MKKNHLVTLNSGSSSIKFAAFTCDSTLQKSLYGQVENIKIEPILKIYDGDDTLIKQEKFSKKLDYNDFFKLLLSAFKSNQFNYTVSAVGHRVVHGGYQYASPLLISAEVLQALKALIPFAPLHQPYNIMAIENISSLFPNLLQVACFDTAFHRTHPPVADRFGLPKLLSDAGIKRYGFHGLSYEYIMYKLKQIDARNEKKRIIIAHLGNGASMCAVKNGKSIDSTMGFTALDGLVMGTRCGSLDPGVVLYLSRYKKMEMEAIERMLYKESGLLGVSGISHNMKTLLNDKSPSAMDAINLFVYRIKRELGALTAVLGGLDMLIFTGGIGELAWEIREQVCAEQDWLGLSINSELNKKNASIISQKESNIEVHVIPTNEEWIIANHTYQFIQQRIGS